jgi:protein CpxP
MAILGLAVLGTTLFGVASARPGRTEARGERIARALDLSPEQARRIAEIRERRWTEGLGQARARHLEARAALREAIDDPSATEEDVRAAARAHADAEEALALERRATRAAVEEVLTPEQRAKASALRERRAERERRGFAARDAWMRGGD